MTTRNWGLVSMIGLRESMEDYSKVVPALVQDNNGGFDYFSLFDGHGGPQVANHCAQNMHNVLSDLFKQEFGNSEVSDTTIKSLVTSSFEIVDKNLDSSIKDDVGSTALVALLSKDKIVVSNCGDSRALLSRGGEIIPLSIDHKPDREDERSRIEQCGGVIFHYCGCPRVFGVLATSRSIGDKGLRPWVIPTPDVVTLDRQPSDQFIIMGTDGLWDVMSNEEATNLTRKVFERRNNTSGSSRAAVAARHLLNFASKRGTHDNTSVIVVDLQS